MQIQLLQSRRFLPLFITQFLGAFNDNFFKNAVVILLTYREVSIWGLSSTQMVALTGGVFILPFFLFSAQSGQLADKFEKTRIIHLVKLAEILMAFLAFWGFVVGSTELLLAVIFLFGTHSTVFGPIKYSILPQHLKDEELAAGNGLIEAGTFLAILLGTIAGGLLITLPNGARIVGIGLISFAFLGYFSSLKIPGAPAVSPHLKFVFNPVTPTWEIFQFTRKNRAVFRAIIGISWFWFFGAAFLSLFPTYCSKLLSLNEMGVTFFLSTFSIGIAVGSVVSGRLMRTSLKANLVRAGVVGMSVFTFDLFLVGNPFQNLKMESYLSILQFLSFPSGMRIVADLFFISVFSGFFTVPLYTQMQALSEATHRSRIIAGNNILNAFFMVAASLYLILLSQKSVSIPFVFLTLALLNSIVGLYISLKNT